MRTTLRVYMQAAACLLFASRSAHALRFQEMSAANGAHILVARDCFNFSEDEHLPYLVYDRQHPCRNGLDHEGVTAARPGYPGDDAVLDYILRLSENKSTGISLSEAASRGYGGDAATTATILSVSHSPRPFAEVWLLSGGGQVDAGIGMARVLRRHGMHVRVPPGYSCVSSCTLMFMGGVLRSVDPGAHFRIHSASRFEGGVLPHEAQSLLKQPDQALIDIARREQIEERYFAIRFLTLAENTLSLPLRLPLYPEEDKEFCRWAGGAYDGDSQDCDATDRPHVDVRLPYAEPGNHQRASDVARIRREHEAAMQDILMRIERDCMQLAIADLETTLPQRGPRAANALAILRAMFITSIKDTSYMSQNELLEMGYVTPDFTP